MNHKRTFRWAVGAVALALSTLTFTRSAEAAPEGHLLRIDPRAGVQGGAPLLTTVLEIVQFNRLNDVLTNAGCQNMKGDASLACVSNALETPNAISSPFPFPEGNARFFVRVDGQEVPAKFDSKVPFGTAAATQPGIGVAWLIMLDASAGMGAKYGDAREVANQFIGSVGPNDLVNLVIFDDRPNQWVYDSKWKTAKEVKAGALRAPLTQFVAPSVSHGGSKPLFDMIKTITKTSFGDLGNAGSGGVNAIPIMQAMVLLSNGAGRQDAATNSVTAQAMHDYFNKGRFPEDNPASPKTPLPVASIYFPTSSGTVNDFYKSNDAQFMQSLSNPEIGGFFDIILGGQGPVKGKKIADIVKGRFDKMWVVKWRLSCLAPTVEQTFNLTFSPFQNTVVKPDGSFKDVPIGLDPSQWPLDINVAQTQAEATANPVHPGGTMKIYGDFCWGGSKERAEGYFIPKGTAKPDPNLNKNDPDVAKKAAQALIAQGMRGGAVEASDTFVTLNVPDDEKILEGTGDATVTRLVLYDNKARRGSGADEKSVLTVKARTKPFNLPLILGGTGAVVVIGLLVVVLVRGGGNKKRGGGPPPAAPGGYAGGAPGYGAPPGGGYGGPPGGGYGGGGYGGGPPLS